MGVVNGNGINKGFVATEQPGELDGKIVFGQKRAADEIADPFQVLAHGQIQQFGQIKGADQSSINIGESLESFLSAQMFQDHFRQAPFCRGR